MFLLPVEKDNPVSKTPFVMYFLVAVNVVAFITTKYILSFDVSLEEYAFVPAAPSVNTAFTSMFLHAGILHILGNMFFLWVFGDNVEDALGGVHFLLAYLLCGFAATGMHYIFNTASIIPTVGASGAISGVLGMYMVFFRYAHVDLEIFIRSTRITVFHLTAFGAVIAWLAEQTALGFISSFTAIGNIIGVAFWAHVGGLLSGISIGFLFRAIGVRSPKPLRPLIIKREKVADIWCPNCGHMEVEQGFGVFACIKCATSYEIVEAKDEENEDTEYTGPRPQINIDTLPETPIIEIKPGDKMATIMSEEDGVIVEYQAILRNISDEYRVIVTVAADEKLRLVVDETRNSLDELSKYMRCSTKFILEDFR